MSGNDSIRKTLLVAFALCIVCSVIVSGAVVMLQPAQEANKALDRKRNILAAAGLLHDGESVEAQFTQVQTRIVDLRTGEFTQQVSAPDYDQRKAARDPSGSDELPATQDIARIGRREHFATVYLVADAQGQIAKIILPVRGYGLWSTLYGFIALESDANTIAGMGFYEHAETPGLGGEVDNPRWKALWPGKQVYRDGDVAITLIKGVVNPDSPNAPWQVDGLAGATLTSNGVSNLLHFWLGQNGFAPFLNKLRAGETRL